LVGWIKKVGRGVGRLSAPLPVPWRPDRDSQVGRLGVCRTNTSERGRGGRFTPPDKKKEKDRKEKEKEKIEKEKKETGGRWISPLEALGRPREDMTRVPHLAGWWSLLSRKN